MDALGALGAPCVAVAALVARAAVGLGPHSGESTPPMYGDYEAQRHWMELTLHLPAREWYEQGEHNDLQYWGLDYPPLTAYHSRACGGLVAALAGPEALALGKRSRGFESEASKAAMRLSVILGDVMCYLPACYAAAMAYYSRQGGRKPGDGRGEKRALRAFAALALQPCLLLIDHGHFQYNGVSLGLSIAGAALAMRGADIAGAVAFALALNHKQMALYYAPAFFAYMLGKALRRGKVRTSNQRSCPCACWSVRERGSKLSESPRLTQGASAGPVQRRRRRGARRCSGVPTWSDRHWRLCSLVGAMVGLCRRRDPGRQKIISLLTRPL